MDAENKNRKEKILVVDDEAVIRELLISYLKMEGYTVDCAGNGIEALTMLKKDTFNLVITDIKMPGMDGLTLMSKIKQQYPELIILVMTGHTTIETTLAAIKRGAYDYIMKPFKIGEIRVAIHNALDRFRLAQENTKLKEMMPLLQVSNELSRTINLDDLLQLILTTALNHTGATRGSLMMLDENRELAIKASVGIEESIVRKSRVKLGEGISGSVAADRKPVLITDVSKHPLFAKLSQHFSEKSFLSVPLVGAESDELLYLSVKEKKKLIGVLNLNEPRTGRNFSQSDLHFLSILANQAAISIENAKLFQSLEKTYLSTMKSLALILEGKNPYTRGHSERVTEYSTAVGREMRLSSKEINTLKYAASLHDIGKIGITDAILNKPGKLTDDEYEIMKQHPAIGYQMLEPIKFLSDSISVVRHHHERVDGKGYPDGIQGEDMSCLERICMVADAYDAMNSTRPYRDVLDKKKIFTELDRNAGTQFDKDVVATIIKLEEIRAN